MDIEIETAGDAVILRLGGRMGTGLRDAIEPLLQQGHRRLVLDLRDITYVDSVGLGEVVGVYMTVRRLDGTLKVRNMTKRMADLLRFTKLESLFEEGSE